MMRMKRRKKPMKMGPGMKKFLSFLLGLVVGIGSGLVPPEYRPMALPAIEALEEELQEAIENAPEPGEDDMALVFADTPDSDSDE